MTIPGWVQNYLLVPYLDGGRTHAGADCWGLVRLVLAERAGAHVESYGEIAATELASIARNARRITAPGGRWRAVEGDPREYDVLLMAGRFETQDGSPRRAAVHVGIMISATHVLHTEYEAGPVVAALTDSAVRFRALRPLYRHETLCPN